MPLSKTQEAEVRKAFSMCDGDGSGSIDIQELRTVVRAVLNEEPSNEQMEQLFKLMDADNSGTIELNEFLDAMGAWFGDVQAEPESTEDMVVGEQILGKKRARTDDEERQHVHKQIKSFFSSVKPSQLGAELQKEVEKYQRMRLLGNASREFLGDDGCVVDASAQAKVDAIKTTRDSLTKCDQIVQAIRSGNVSKQVLAVEEVAKLLSICEVFLSPSDRMAIAPLFMKVFVFLLRCRDVIEIMVKCVGVNNPQLQNIACKALTLFVPGPCLISLPKSHMLHPSQAVCKRICISAGLIPILIDIINRCPHGELKQNAVACVGAIASHNAETRDILLQHGILNALTGLISINASNVLMRKVSWAMGRLYGVTHTRLPNYQLLVSTFSAAGWLFASFDDPQVVINCAEMLAVVLPGSQDDQISQRVIELLKLEGQPEVVQACVDLITAVAFWGNEGNCEPFYHYGLFEILPTLLEHDSADVRVAAAECLCTLVEKRNRSANVIEAIPVERYKRLLGLEQSDSRVAKLLMLLTRPNASSVTSTQVAYLVRHKLVDTIVTHLSNFKEYDSVLVECYNYLGASYNTELIEHLLLALRHILLVGRQDSRDVRVNEYALKIDLNAVDKLASLLETIAGTNSSELRAWRSGNNSFNIEDHIRDIFGEARRAHQTQPNVASSRAVVEMIDRHMGKYSKTIWVRLNYEDEEARVGQITPAMSFEELANMIGSMHTIVVVAFYKNAAGDMVPFENASHLRDAIDLYETQKRSYLDLFIKPKPGLPRPSSLVDISRPIEISNEAMAVTDEQKFNMVDKQALLKQLASGASFSAADLNRLQEFWQKMSGGNPTITRDHFISGMKQFDPRLENNPLLLEQLFCLSDEDNSGNLDFREFTTFLTHLMGSDEDKLRLMFNAYDVDRSNSLSRQEVFLMLRSSSEAYRTDTEVMELVERIFKLVDTNNDGQLSLEEFITGYRQGNISVSLTGGN